MKESDLSSPPTPVSVPVSAPDPYDIGSFLVDQDYQTAPLVKKIWTTVPVGKPKKEWFVRTHPDKTYRSNVHILDLKDENETYLVHGSMLGHLEGLTQLRTLVTAQTRQGVPFLWSVKLPDLDGKIDTWNASAAIALARSEKEWVSIRSNRPASAYDVLVADGKNLSEPDWSEFPPFLEILTTAFRDKIITTPDHPIVRRLKGQI